MLMIGFTSMDSGAPWRYVFPDEKHSLSDTVLYFALLTSCSIYFTHSYFFLVIVSLRSDLVARKLGRKQSREKEWRSGKSAHLPPMWPGFDSQTRRHMG